MKNVDRTANTAAEARNTNNQHDQNNNNNNNKCFELNEHLMKKLFICSTKRNLRGSLFHTFKIWTHSLWIFTFNINFLLYFLSRNVIKPKLCALSVRWLKWVKGMFFILFFFLVKAWTSITNKRYRWREKEEEKAKEKWNSRGHALNMRSAQSLWRF